MASGEGLASAVAPPLTSAPAAAMPPVLPATEIRRAFVHNLHTGETLNAVYWESGRYVPGALAEAMRVMRDWRNGQEHVMDPRLFDLLHGLRGSIETTAPFQIISAHWRVPSFE